MTARQNLNLKLILSTFLAFAISLVLTWVVHNKLSERDAYKMIDGTFECVENEIADCMNERLIRQCMIVRERLEDGYPTDCNSLQNLANELHVTEICIAGKTGVMEYSSVPEYLGHDGKEPFNFAFAGGQAGEMMCLINGMETEYCQRLQKNSHNGELRKYVAVWRPEGGFVQIGCDEKASRELSRSSIVDLFRNWRIAGTGGIVVTGASGLILSDYEEPNREGMHWSEPGDENFYWRRKEIDGFIVYVIIPRSVAAIQRDVLVGTTAFLSACSLAFVVLLVAFVITRFVRAQMQEQTAKDLKLAAEIQNTAMPTVFPPYPEEVRFDIWASMKTAKEVGGDFYDFYYIDTSRLVFLIADVSGKGVPAALFMMRAKTLIKSAAQTGKLLEQAIAEVNDALSEGNASNTFVTLWVGKINLKTGNVTYVNAGHNPPLVRRNGKVEYLRGSTGVALGAMPGMVYKAQTLKLEPNDAIYLYTDGITEQPNLADELYGEERLRKLAGSHVHNQAELLDKVVANVMDFAGKREQADDCTQLVIRYRGLVEKKMTHSYKTTMDDLKKATADLEADIESVPMKYKMKLMVAADEICANILRYSGAKEWTLTVEFAKHPDMVRLIFTDDGVQFDPLTRCDPDTTLPAEERSIGGMGIFIVKKTMSPVTYTYKDGSNVLTTCLVYGE